MTSEQKPNGEPQASDEARRMRVRLAFQRHANYYLRLLRGKPGEEGQIRLALRRVREGIVSDPREKKPGV